MAEQTEYMTVQVTVSATIAVPVGTVLEGERGLRTPNGELLKVWPTLELTEDADGDEVLLDLPTAMLSPRGVHLEPGGATMVEQPL